MLVKCFSNDDEFYTELASRKLTITVAVHYYA